MHEQRLATLLNKLSGGVLENLAVCVSEVKRAGAESLVRFFSSNAALYAFQK